MKKLVVLGILITAVSLVFAQTQSQTQKKATTTFEKKRTHVPVSPTPPPIRKQNTDGVLPRMARGGNPLQMLNPKAPPEYGRAEDSVELDPDTGKWKGIKLFTINF